VPEHKPEVAAVPLNLLIVDPVVQRPLDKRKADKIAADLNLDAVGLICVSRRANGSYSIIDGQHRVDALRTVGFTTDSVDCEVYDGLTLAAEAAMFRLRNNRSSVQKIDLFRVRVVEGDPTAVAINDMLARLGWTVRIGKSDGDLAAVDALERAWNLDPDGQPPAAERTIAAVTAAWGHNAAGVDRAIIGGVAAVFARYGPDVSTGDLIDRLARYAGGPNNLVGNGRGLSGLLGCTVPIAVAEIVVNEYNRRRKTRALPPWRAQ
jgi:hypothetical protein